ncbi:putative glutamine-fructose-6-phosphate transaminase, partial [Cooperia oncophora]
MRSAHLKERDNSTTNVEYFVASDAAAIIEHTKQVLFLEDDDVAFVEDGALTIHRFTRKASDATSDQKREVQNLNLELQQIMKGNFKTFMQKEIFEQPDSVVNTMRGRLLPSGQVVLGGIKDYVADIKRCRRLIMVACGTSYNSAIACRQILEELSELPVVLELASDFLDRETPIFRDDVCIFVSQSGETADTLMALRYCKPRGALLIGVTNTVGSSICRESHCGIHINAGPEIGVASTKAYTSQILSLLMFALVLSDDRISMINRRREIINAMNHLPDLIREVLTLDQEVLKIAEEIYKEKSLLIMGRGFNFATCLEGALKIKCWNWRRTSFDRETPIFRDDVCIFVSQSGIVSRVVPFLIGVTNTVGSSICRESHCGIHINAGPEIGVASTKAYTSQILSLLMFALVLSDDRISMINRRREIINAMNHLPDLIREVLTLDQEVLKIAEEIYKEKSLLIMGRGFNFATCLEGALKIKELSYMHCEGIMSGELKHGPLAMVDEKLRICMIICKDTVYSKSLNALQQVVARGGAPIIIADKTVPENDLAGMKHILRVPKTVDCVQNILTVIPLQLMSYHIAELNGY